MVDSEPRRGWGDRLGEESKLEQWLLDGPEGMGSLLVLGTVLIGGAVGGLVAARIGVPRVTGNIDVHDMSMDSDGRLVFVNTLFNCLATTDDVHNFVPVWRPPWISKMVPEDRCHLNGLAMRVGKARYCTAVSRSDVHDAWRDKRQGSGVVISVI